MPAYVMAWLVLDAHYRIIYSLVDSCKANKVNPFTYITYRLDNVRNKDVTLLLPDEFTVDTVPLIG